MNSSTASLEEVVELAPALKVEAPVIPTAPPLTKALKIVRPTTAGASASSGTAKSEPQAAGKKNPQKRASKGESRPTPASENKRSEVNASNLPEKLADLQAEGVYLEAKAVRNAELAKSEHDRAAGEVLKTDREIITERRRYQDHLQELLMAKQVSSFDLVRPTGMKFARPYRISHYIASALICPFICGLIMLISFPVFKLLGRDPEFFLGFMATVLLTGFWMFVLAIRVFATHTPEPGMIVCHHEHWQAAGHEEGGEFPLFETGRPDLRPVNQRTVDITVRSVVLMHYVVKNTITDVWSRPYLPNRRVVNNRSLNLVFTQGECGIEQVIPGVDKLVCMELLNVALSKYHQVQPSNLEAPEIAMWLTNHVTINGASGLAPWVCDNTAQCAVSYLMAKRQRTFSLLPTRPTLFQRIWHWDDEPSPTQEKNQIAAMSSGTDFLGGGAVDLSSFRLQDTPVPAESPDKQKCLKL